MPCATCAIFSAAPMQQIAECPIPADVRDEMAALMADYISSIVERQAECAGFYAPGARNGSRMTAQVK